MINNISKYKRSFENESYRSNHQRCSIKRAVFKKFLIFTGKYLCWSLFLTNLQAGLQLYWKETPTQVFSCEYCEISMHIYFERHM